MNKINTQTWEQLTLDEIVKDVEKEKKTVENTNKIRKYVDENTYLIFTINDKFFTVFLNINNQVQTMSTGKKLELYMHTGEGHNFFVIHMYRNKEDCIEDFCLHISKELYSEIIKLLKTNKIKYEYNWDWDFSVHTFTINEE